MTDPRGPVHRVDGPGGLPAVELSLPNGARAMVCLHGAHVISYVPRAGADDALYLSPRSDFRPGVAIRGGVPVIFPQFSDRGPLPKHGFARTLEWELEDSWTDSMGESAGVHLLLRDTPGTRGLWPHPFELLYTVTLSRSALDLGVHLANKGEAALRFTGALHTYLRVADVRRTVVEGLQGVRYIEQTAGRTVEVDDDDAVAFPGEVDRIYLDVPRVLRVVDRTPGAGRTIQVESKRFPDAVVWNPGPTKAASLADLGADEYPRLVCVEAACAARPVELEGGALWTGAQRLSVR